MRTGSISLRGEQMPGAYSVVKVSNEEAMRIAFDRLVAWAGGRDVTTPGYPRCFHLVPGSGLPEFLERHGMQMTFMGVVDNPDPIVGIMRFEIWEATGSVPLDLIKGASASLERLRKRQNG